MKNIIAIVFALFTIVSSAFSNNISKVSFDDLTCCFNKKETLPAGTTVLLETTGSLDSGNLTDGQLAQFKVKADVRVNGEVVIRTGSIATGRVKRIKKGSYNSPGSVFVEVTTVQSVDGQLIALNPTEQELKGYYRGEAAKIQPGTMFSAAVMNDTSVCTK